jgi:hypothetical protein
MKRYIGASQFFPVLFCEVTHCILKFTTMLFGTLALPALEVYL